MMRKCAEAAALMEDFAQKGSVLAVSDAACGAVLCGAGIQAAWLNVCINTKSIKDRPYAERINAEGRELLAKTLPLCERVYKTVEEKLT